MGIFAKLEKTPPEDKIDFLAKPQLDGLKTKAIKGGGVSIIAQVISLGIRVVEVVVLSRLLQPRDFGLVTMVTSFYLLLMNFGINGFTEYIIQKKTIDHAELSTIFWLHAGINFLLMIGFIGAAPILAAFYKEPVIRPIAMVMALGIMVQMLSTHHLAILKRKMEFKKVALNSVVSGFISVIIAVVLAITGFGYWAIVGRQLSYLVLIGVGSWIMCRWRPGLPGNLSTAVGSLKFALQVYGNFLLDYFSRNLDKILLGRFHGSTILGNYDRAYHLKSVPAGQLVTPLHSVGLATLSRLRDVPDKYIRYYTKALCTLSFVGVFASIVLTLAGRDLIFILLGSGWEQAGSVMTAFGPGIGAMIVYSTYNWLHLSLSRPGRWLRWSIVSLVVTAALLAASAPFGPVFVAAAYSVSYFALLVPAIAYAGKPIGIRVLPIIKAIGPYFLSGLIVCGIWICGMVLFANLAQFINELSQILRLCLVFVFGMITYVLLVIVFHRTMDPIKEPWQLIKVFVLNKKSAP